MKNLSLKQRIIVLVLSSILIIETILSLYMLLKPNFRVYNFKKNISIEYNDNYSNDETKVCYGNFFSCNKLNAKVDGIIDTKKLGNYNVKYVYKYKNKQLILKQTVKIKDMTKPIIDIKSSEAIVCPNGKINKIDYLISDNYDKDLSKKVKTKYNKDKSILDIFVKDSSGNESKKSIKAIVKDEDAPIITLNGNENVYLFTDQTYTDEGATSKDNCDDVSVESSSDINNKQEGIYNLYIAR